MSGLAGSADVWGFEVLICDDGSTDGTEEVVGRYLGALNLHYLWSENSGGRHVPGTPDCDWPGELTQRFSIPTIGGSHVSSSYAYKRSTVARMSFITICTWPGSAGQRVYLRRRNARELRAPAFENLICNGNAMANSSVVVRRDLIRRIGGFSEVPPSLRGKTSMPGYASPR